MLLFFFTFLPVKQMKFVLFNITSKSHFGKMVDFMICCHLLFFDSLHAVRFYMHKTPHVKFTFSTCNTHTMSLYNERFIMVRYSSWARIVTKFQINKKLHIFQSKKISTKNCMSVICFSTPASDSHYHVGFW